MHYQKQIPLWLVGLLRVALLGEIYENIRAIAVGYNAGCVMIRYYLNRVPIDSDFESIEIVSVNLDALGCPDVSQIDVECIFAACKIADLNPLSGYIYVRREFM